jgi:predicted RNA-binding Zn-ribbon protein involved in translation (DUF1610 family)
MSSVAPLHRSLEQELLAVLRGASLECPVCGEFVLHEGPHVRCPECGMRLHGRIADKAGEAEGPVQSGTQAG